MKRLVGISFVIVVLDQFSKYMIVETLDQCVPGFCESIDMLPFFKLVLLYNEGAAFSMLSDAGGWQRWFLSIISFVVSMFIFFWLMRLKASEQLLGLGLAAILGGAVGNLIDRVFLGHVVDYFLFYYKSFYFPAFNIADAAISIGAALLILDMVITNRTTDVQ